MTAGLEGTSPPEVDEAPDAQDFAREMPIDASADHGYRDRTAAEFRADHRQEFLEPMARPYEIERFSDPDTLVRRVNPDFGDPSDSYNTNCADCARSFEQSWRGQMEEAAGRPPEIVPAGGLVVHGEPASLSERPSLTEEWAGERFTAVSDTDAFRERLQAAGHGASAIVHTQYGGPEGGGGAHAYNVVNDHGVLKVCDAQEGYVSTWTDGSIHPELGPMTSHLAMGWNAAGGRIW